MRGYRFTAMINPVVQISDFIKSNFITESVDGNGYNDFKCIINHKRNSIKISIKREEIGFYRLPHVNDWTHCHYCGIQFRCRHVRNGQKQTCSDCRNTKTSLLVNGLSRKKVANDERYDELIGSKTLLKRLKKTLRSANPQEV